MLRDDPYVTRLPPLLDLEELAKPSSDGCFTYDVSTQAGLTITHRAVVTQLFVVPNTGGSSVGLKFLSEFSPERIVSGSIEALYEHTGEMICGDITLDRHTLHSGPHLLFPKVLTTVAA